MNVIFMGTPEFAVPSLKRIINSTHKVAAVFTQKPKPQGRGLELTKSPIHSIAYEHGITAHTPSTLRSDDVIDLINSINADIIVVAAYGFILPKSVLESKKYGCINLHPSRLPRFRGAAPLQHTIISRDKESSICIIQMDEGMDTGDILLQKDFNLPESPTLKWLHDYTSNEGGKMIVEVLDDYENMPHKPQSQNGVVLAPKLRKEDSKINWNQDAFEIEAKIRGYSAWPGSFISTNIGDIKIIEAVALEFSHNSIPSTILDKNLMIIACAKNALKLELIRNDSGKLVSISDFINGLRGQKISII
jgi:methionyl-tRNA formyltransferase